MSTDTTPVTVSATVSVSAARARRYGSWYVAEHSIRRLRGYRATIVATAFGTPVLYMATMDRGFMVELRKRAAESEFGPDEDELDGADTMGEPSERITTEVDVSPWVATKREAMRAHASQIGEDSFFLSMPEDLFAEVWGQEWYIRVRPEPVGLGEGVREGGLVVASDGTLAGGNRTGGAVG